MSAVQHLDLPLKFPSGPDCERCVTRLQDGLMLVRGIQNAAVNNIRSSVSISYDPDAVTLSRIEVEAERIGASLADSIDHHSFDLRDMDCPDCATSIERSVGRLPGVIWCSANFAAGQVHIESENGALKAGELKRTIEAHGVRALPIARSIETPTSGAAEAKITLGDRWAANRRWFSTSLSVCLAVVGAVMTQQGALQSAIAPLAGSIAVGGWSSLRAALVALRSRRLDMNVLMTLAVIGAMAISEWMEAATVVCLFGVGNLLQANAMDRTRRSIRALMDKAPRTALVRRGTSELEVPIEQVRLGETLIVKPGGYVPMDGQVLVGASHVDQAPITGESMPVEKTPGDQVFAGTLNGSGCLEIQVSRAFNDTTLARIVQLVEEAQSQRAPAQQFVDRFAARYTPIVVVAAVIVSVGPPAYLWLSNWMIGASMLPWVWTDWLVRGLSLVLIACPCALVISTPVAIVTAIGAASRHGALIKGGAHLEALADVRAILYDKTGTLTSGKFELHDVVALDSMPARRAIEIVAAIEARSGHPLATAFLKAVDRQNGSVLPSVSAFDSIPGLGVRAVVEGETWHVGSAAYMRSIGADTSSTRETLDRVGAIGRTAIIAARGTQPIAVFVLADTPRENIKESVDELRRMGIAYQAMLTGDNVHVAKSVAEQMGLDDYKACLLPEHKLALIKEFQKQYGAVAMVGDGVNDAPALATANVGIAMGAAATDTAMETADIALMGDDLGRLPHLIRLSRRTRSIIRQNVFVSLGTKAGLLVAAIGVGIPLWLAVLGDVGVSLLVTLNALRLRSNSVWAQNK